MAIQLITTSPLTTNYAEFKNDAAQGQDLGTLAWDNPYEDNGLYYVDVIEGTDVSGVEIDPVKVEIPESETVNPTKIWWAAVAVLKAVLCSECV